MKFLLSVLVFGIFLFIQTPVISHGIDDHHEPEFELVVYEYIEPSPIAVPVVPVVFGGALAPIKRASRNYLIDCDKEREPARIALACNIYHEARSQSPEGQIAVGLVTKNRVESSRYPDTFSDVVWQIRWRCWIDPKTNKKRCRKVGQFSWVVDGKGDKVRDSEAWFQALNIANGIISGEYKDFTVGSMWYHTKAVKPGWRLKLKVTTVVDDHIFYRK